MVRAFLRAFLAAAVLAMAASGAGAASLSGLAYNPSGIGTFAVLERGISEDHLRNDLTQLAPLTGEIRFYSTDHGLDRILPIAASLRLKVTVGVYLGRDPVQNDAEINRAIMAVKTHRAVVSRVMVGNESVQRGDCSVDDVIQAMEAVRRGVGPSIPVGTGEIWSVWLREPRLAAASAFIGAHIIPYWDGVGVDEAVPYIYQRVEELRQAFPGKPIIIAETGWPASGPVREGAVPSPANQAAFARAFVRSGTAHTHAYFLDEAYDQPWKAAREGDQPLWGLFDVNRGPKPVVEVLRALQP